MSNQLFLRSPLYLIGGFGAVLGSLAASQVVAEPMLEPVYVSATRSETAPMPVATQIKVISAEDIRVSGANQLSEVLRTQAGIQLTDFDGSGARTVTASMRGLSGANNVLVLVDGRKLNNPTLAAPALNTIALKDVERIEIVQGSAGVLYGDQAVGGVINVITHRAVVGEVDGSLSVVDGSDKLEDYTASVRQGFENGLSYSVSAQKRHANNFRDNNQSDYENMLGNLRYDFARGFVFVEGQTIDDELRYPGSISYAQALLDPRMTYSPNDYGNQYTDLLRVGLGIDLTDSWQLLAEYADRDEDSDVFYDDYFPPINTPSIINSNLRVKNITPRLVGNFTTANGLAVVTLGYDQVDADYTGFSTITQKVDGFYGQLVYPLSKHFILSTGIRHAWVDDQNFSLAKVHEDDVNVGELGLTYQMTEQWSLFGRYADGFRFANADENASLAPGVEFLDVQTSQSYEVGARWHNEQASVSYSLYDMGLDDEIVYDNASFANVNLPDSERRGFIFEGQVKLSNEIGLHGNYTYTDAELSSGAYKGNRVPYTSENTFNVGVNFTPIDALIVNVESTYLGSRYLLDDEANAQPKVDAIQLFGVNVVWEYKRFEVAGRIKNITDEHYAGLQASWGQYPQPGRYYETSVTYRF